MTSDLEKAASRSLPRELSDAALGRLPFALCLADPNRDDCPVVWVNERFTELTGYTSQEALGRNCRFLQGEGTDPAAVKAIGLAIRAGEEVTADLLNYRADGSRFMNRLYLAPIRSEEGAVQFYLGVQAEVEDKEGLHGRTVTGELQKLHHRVKNHLGLVLAMIRLEAVRSEEGHAFETLTRRVETLTLLYDRYGHDVGGDVPLGAYLSGICQSVQRMIDPVLVRVNVEVEEMPVDQDKAARLGLFLSEVLDNALRHAFADDQEGEVRVTFACGGEEGVLSVVDDGCGIGEGDWPASGGISGQIVRDLVKRMAGDLSVEGGPGGTAVSLRFPLSQLRSGPA